jgi:hypothetical protein
VIAASLPELRCLSTLDTPGSRVGEERMVAPDPRPFQDAPPVHQRRREWQTETNNEAPVSRSLGEDPSYSGSRRLVFVWSPTAAACSDPSSSPGRSATHPGDRGERAHPGHHRRGPSTPTPPPPGEHVPGRSTEPAIQADVTHRAHAIVETVWSDLIDGPWAHQPSGSFAANAAWTVRSDPVGGVTARCGHDRAAVA